MLISRAMADGLWQSTGVIYDKIDKVLSKRAGIKNFGLDNEIRG